MVARLSIIRKNLPRSWVSALSVRHHSKSDTWTPGSWRCVSRMCNEALLPPQDKEIINHLLTPQISKLIYNMYCVRTWSELVKLQNIQWLWNTSITLATSCIAGSLCLFVIFEKRISCRPANSYYMIINFVHLQFNERIMVYILPFI